MDAARFHALHGYGAVLSVVAVAGAVVAFVVGGPATSVGLFLGLVGPLAAFYFAGAYLSYTSTHRVLGEELLRAVAWYFGSLVGWSVLVTESNAFDASAVTVFVLPALTALGVTLAMVGLRSATGLDLKVQTTGGQLLVAVTGSLAGAFLVLYLVLVSGQSPVLVPVYVLGTAAGFALWWRRWRPRADAA